MRTGMWNATDRRRPFAAPNKKGRRDHSQRPFLSVFAAPSGAADYLPNWRYLSLPTKPNLVTPEVLMFCNTLADRS